ncbi:MAG: hypothetical protein KH754_03310, partial [Bacteroides ovatus]|nr:hypothetical protein [Bacteroides ovatus]
TKKQTYLQLLIGLRKKKTVEIKKRLPPNLTKNRFFNFIEEGLRIKIRVTTVIINPIHLCALRVLCGENSAKMNYSIK